MDVFIAVMHLVVAAAFVSIPLVRHRYGPAATATAHAELDRQGVRTTVLTENGMRFDAGGHETAVPASVAAAMAVLAGLHLAGAAWAVPLTWGALVLVVIGNCLIIYSNRTAAASVRAAFARTGDPELARIDVPALLAAAERGFPAWTWTLEKARHTAVFGASALALAALAVTALAL
ncbi:hypothetical protein ACFPZ0_01465 [Streptomonospora nanhaiensis]|uniref:Uncharacterized protein n=1 Tax=Streptomonospora nanhaiensis TaxID=1323731 RepID=A0A853BLW7_9ACTN|nr:hypothetical protein [Streptomonospora nanhaiensis]MBV2365773.1 hypothetical protein [Streptomonospora nanhaiensis]MBX9388080.1 hypothetical protein [Streptomonospora nanhaiensis]NYI96468.1 hypothetical protein [Streptomonospora nanhaiensis]